MEVLKGSVNVTANIQDVLNKLKVMEAKYESVAKKMETPITSTVTITGVQSLANAVTALKGLRVASTVKTIERLGVALNSLKLNPQSANILERYANSLQRISIASGGVSAMVAAVRAHSLIPGLLQKQQIMLDKLKQREQQRAEQAQKLSGVYSVMQNILQNVAQAAYWSIVYGTIYKIREVLMDAVELSKELDFGIGKAMRTGLTKEEVGGAFNPTAMYEGTDIAIKPVIDKYRELISLQALIFTSKHTSTVKNYTDALYELTSANIKLSSAMEFAGTSAKVALAAEGDVIQTTRSLAGLYNIFGDSIKGAKTEQEKFNQIANTVLYVWGKEQMELSDLNYALKYSANIARIMNMDYRVLIATIGHLNTNMLRGSTAGTGLRQVWNSMAKDMNQLKYTFGDINKFLGDNAAAQREAFDPSKPMDFVKVIGALRDKLLANGQAQLDSNGKIMLSTNQLSELLKTMQIRGANVVASLILTYDEWKAKIQEVTSLNANFIDDFVRMQEMGISQQMEIFFKNVKLLPAAFMAGADSGREIALSLADMNGTFEDLIKQAYVYGKVFSESWGSAEDFIASQIPTLQSFFKESVFWLSQAYVLLKSIASILSSLSPFGTLLYTILKVVVQTLNTSLLITVQLFNTMNYGIHLMGTGVDMIINGIATIIQKYNDWNGLIKEGIYWSKVAQNQQAENAKKFVEDTASVMKSIQETWSTAKMPSLPGMDAKTGNEADAWKAINKAQQELADTMGDTGEAYKALDINSKTFQDDLATEIEAVKQTANEYYQMGNAMGYAQTLGAGFADIRKQIVSSYGGNELSKHAKDLQTVMNYTQSLNSVTEEWQMSLEDTYMMIEGTKGKRGRKYGFLKQHYAELSQEWEQMIATFKGDAEKASNEMQEIINNLFIELDMPSMKGIQKDLFKLEINQGEERKKVQDLVSVYQEEISKLQGLSIRNPGEEALLKADLEKLAQLQSIYTALIADQSAEREGIITASEKKLSDFLMGEEDKKRQNIIDTHMDLMKEYEGDADAQVQIKRHLTDALKDYDAQQVASDKDKQATRIKGEMEAAEAILKIRKQLLDDLQEKAGLELDIEHQKQVNKLKQEALGKMALAKTDEERQAIKDQLEMQLSMLDATYDIKDATLEQEQAQERINTLLEEQALLQKEIAQIASGKGEFKNLTAEQRDEAIQSRKMRLSEIDTQITGEQLKMEQATGNIAEAQINAIDKVSSESDQKLKQYGERSLPGVMTAGGFVPGGGAGFTGMPSFPTQLLNAPQWNPADINKTPGSLLRNIKQGQQMYNAPSIPTGGGGNSMGIMLNSLFNNLSGPTASKEQKGNLSTFAPAASLPTSMFPSFVARGPAGNLNIRDLPPANVGQLPQVNLYFNDTKATGPLPQDVQESVRGTVNVLSRYMRRRGGSL